MNTWHCPYCGNPVADERSACCGEVGHAELEPIEEEMTKVCRTCDRLFHPEYSDDRYCRGCNMSEVETDQNGFRIRSEHVPK